MASPAITAERNNRVTCNCAICGYPIDDQSSCPECGAGADAVVYGWLAAVTSQRRRQIGWIVRGMCVGAVLHAATVVGAGVYDSDGRYSVVYFLLAALTLVTLPFWIALLFIASQAQSIAHRNAQDLAHRFHALITMSFLALIAGLGSLFAQALSMTTTLAYAHLSGVALASIATLLSLYIGLNLPRIIRERTGSSLRPTTPRWIQLSTTAVVLFALLGVYVFRDHPAMSRFIRDDISYAMILLLWIPYQRVILLVRDVHMSLRRMPSVVTKQRWHGTHATHASQGHSSRLEHPAAP